MEYNKKQIDTLLAEIKGCRCVKKQYLKWKPHTVLVKKSEIMDELKSYRHDPEGEGCQAEH